MFFQRNSAAFGIVGEAGFSSDIPVPMIIGTAALLAALAPTAFGLTVTGALTYDASLDEGYEAFVTDDAPEILVNGSGIAIGNADRYTLGEDVGFRAVRFGVDAAGAFELDTLGFDEDGYALARVFAINEAGESAGWSFRYDNLSVQTFALGGRAVRWDANGVATELDALGLSASGTTTTIAYALNASGAAVGTANQYDGAGASLGTRAVRWYAGGTSGTLLGSFGDDVGGDVSAGATQARAWAINDAGAAAGWSWVYDGAGVYQGQQAVRWDAGTTAATALEALGVSAAGLVDATAVAINASGTAVGSSERYDAGVGQGLRPVRWDAGGSAATELDTLGTTTSGVSFGFASAVNDAGAAVGVSSKYDGTGAYLGERAVRWDAGGATALELETLGTDAGGGAEAAAFALNEAGTAAGFSDRYSNSGTFLGQRAVVWRPDGSVIDLNDLALMDAAGAGTWTLTETRGLASDGWVTGLGTFVPSGGFAYERSWVAQVGLGGDWLNTTGTDNLWRTGNNWSSGTPAIQLDANFVAAGSYTVAFGEDAQARAVAVNAGQVTFALGPQSLTVTDGLSIASGAALTANGTLIADVGNLGTLGPGSWASSIELLTIDGTLNSSGTLILEIVSALNHDRIDVSGAATLGGTLRLSAQSSAGLNYGDTMTVLTANSISGAFDLIQGVIVDDTTALAVTADGTQIVATVALPGDANLDGLVGLLDLDLLGSSWNQSGTWVNGDFNGDGLVSLLDLDVLGANWNTTASFESALAASGISIPEPTSILLMFTGGLCALRPARKS